MVFSSNAARPSSFPLAIATGVLVGVVTSGGIIGERMSEGSLRVGVAANLVTTLVALVLSLYVSKRAVRSSSAFVLAQAAGVLLGIAALHLGLRELALPSLPWLTERPAQWMNDFVAAFGLLALVAALSGRVDRARLAFGTALVLLYRHSAGRWHLDHAPHGFEVTVQQLVVAELASIALALVLYRSLVLARRTP